MRCYDRHRDFGNPDHPRELLQQRRKAQDQKLLMRLLALTPKAKAFYQELQQRRLNVLHHVRKIVALSEIYGTDKAARATPTPTLRKLAEKAFGQPFGQLLGQCAYRGTSPIS